MIDAGLVTTQVSDNNQADGSGVLRIVDLKLLGSSRVTHITAIQGATYWGVECSFRNVANTGGLSGATGSIVYTNTASAKTYLLYDAKMVCFIGYSAPTPFCIVKMKNGSCSCFLATTYIYFDGSDTRYSQQGSKMSTYLCPDGVSSFFVAYWSVCDTSGRPYYALGDNYKFDSNVWCGIDKFTCADKQMLEITSGNYLVKIAPLFIGYIE